MEEIRIRNQRFFINQQTYEHYLREGIKLDKPIFKNQPPKFLDEKGNLLPPEEQRLRWDNIKGPNL